MAGGVGEEGMDGRLIGEAGTMREWSLNARAPDRRGVSAKPVRVELYRWSDCSVVASCVRVQLQGDLHPKE